MLAYLLQVSRLMGRLYHAITWSSTDTVSALTCNTSTQVESNARFWEVIIEMRGKTRQTYLILILEVEAMLLKPHLHYRVPVTVTTIYRDDNEVQAAKGGENLRLRLGGVDEDEVSPGFVLCSRHLPVPAVTYFDAQLHLLDLLEHKSLFSAGYKAILHIHAAVEECEITALLAQIDPKTKQKKKVRPALIPAC